MPTPSAVSAASALPARAPLLDTRSKRASTPFSSGSKERHCADSFQYGDCRWCCEVRQEFFNGNMAAQAVSLTDPVHSSYTILKCAINARPRIAPYGLPAFKFTTWKAPQAVKRKLGTYIWAL